MKRLFLWLVLPFLVVPLWVHAATVEVLGKHQRTDGSIYNFQVQDGDALSPGDRFQIVIEAKKRTFYSVIYFSRDGKATQLFPLRNKRGDIKAGSRLFIPSKDNYFTLDTNGGRELMFVVTSPHAISNIKSVLKGSKKVGNTSEEIYAYLKGRLASVEKLEITNTGGKVTGLADQISSGLVRDISRTYEANPWPESFSKATDSRRRTRRSGDTSIPSEVRRRAKEVRALLRRPAGAPSSSSLRTVKVDQKSGRVRRDTPMLANNEEQKKATAEAARVDEKVKRLEEEQAAARQEAEEKRLQEELAEVVRIKEEERRLELAKAEEAARRLGEEPIAAVRAVAEVKRLEKEQKAAAEEAEAKRLETERTEAARVAEENRRLEEERVTAARAAAEVKRLEEERLLAGSEKAPEQSKSLFGQMFSFLSGGEETGSSSDEGSEKDSEIITTESLVEVRTDEQPVVEIDKSSEIIDTTPQQPLEAVVVLQAPARPAPPRLSAPAPVRVEVLPAEAPSAEALRQLYAEVASAIVSIDAGDNSQGSGFILDRLGHILSSWHLVNRKKEVDVRFIGISGEPPLYKAKVVKYNKFRDLALLKLVNPPEGIQPITLAGGALPDAGSTVRVFGQKDGRIWATNDGVITRIAQNFTWFSKDNVIHRGEILQIDLPSSGKGIGALVTSMDYKLLGIRSFSGKETGRTYAVSVRTILEFLQLGK